MQGSMIFLLLITAGHRICQNNTKPRNEEHMFIIANNCNPEYFNQNAIIDNLRTEVLSINERILIYRRLINHLAYLSVILILISNDVNLHSERQRNVVIRWTHLHTHPPCLLAVKFLFHNCRHVFLCLHWLHSVVLVFKKIRRIWSGFLWRCVSGTVWNNLFNWRIILDNLWWIISKMLAGCKKDASVLRTCAHPKTNIQLVFSVSLVSTQF